jgi:hypothetical protein
MTPSHNNPLFLESVFGDRIQLLRMTTESAEELDRELGALLQEIDTNISLAHIERDESALVAWESARQFVVKEIS